MVRSNSGNSSSNLDREDDSWVPVGADATEAAELEQLVHTWIRSGRHDAYLLRDERLYKFQRWARLYSIGPAAQDFLDASRRLEGSQSSRVHWIYRWLACAIDMVLILMLTLFLSFFRIDFIDPLWHFLINAVSVYFFFFFFGYRFGRTPGLWLTGLWVTSLIDDRMTWKQAAIRVLLNWTPAADRVSSTRVRFDERRLWRLSGKPLVVRIIVSLANLIIMWSIVSFVFCLIVGYLSDMGSPPFMSGRARAIFYGYFGLYPDEFSTSPEFVASILVAHMTNIAYWIVLLKLIEYKKLIGLRIAAGILCIYSFKTIPIVIFLLTLHPSVGRYCQGVLPHMRVFLEYRRRKKNQP